jgi:hypothetical protein
VLQRLELLDSGVYFLPMDFSAGGRAEQELWGSGGVSLGPEMRVNRDPPVDPLGWMKMGLAELKINWGT